MSDASRVELSEMERRKSDAENRTEDTESNLAAVKTQARVEGLIGNPD